MGLPKNVGYCSCYSHPSNIYKVFNLHVLMTKLNKSYCLVSNNLHSSWKNKFN